MGGVGSAVAEGPRSPGDRRCGPSGQLIDGIRFRVRTGIPWPDLPAEYWPWGRAYDLFRRWQRDGTWFRIFTPLQAQADTKELITWDINVDSTVRRAHQHAAGARKRGSCRRNRPAASPSSRTTMGSGARAAAWPRGCTWLSSRARSPRPS
ncbi:transposase [Streptomyces sp. NPDC013953]|uniref:transposase n=1 Tax=Streptomyces sp. NPDC013953 TaxID=3364868 RepID=UPI0036F9076B